LEVYALVGPSGTGKSHRAAVIAHNMKAQVIIDDGLLINRNRILAGASAKSQPTRLGAIKSSLFINEEHVQEIKDVLEDLYPERILILGTSLEMVKRISSRLDLPLPAKVINIEDVASEKELRKAKFLRTRFSKHVIPAPTLEVKKSFPGVLVDPLKIFLRHKDVKEKKDWLEKSVVRPTFTFHGKLTIANSALSAIIEHTAGLIKGVEQVGKININAVQKGIITIDISPTFTFGYNLQDVAVDVQQKVKQAVENMTGLQVAEVNVHVKGLTLEGINEGL
jgi:uncharacterized alkaline shock family protein YloU